MKSTGMKGDLYQAQKERLLHVMLGHMALSHYLSSCLLAGTICDVEGCYFGLSNVSNTKRDFFFSVFFFHASGPTSTKSRCQRAGLVLSEGSYEDAVSSSSF